MTIRRVIGKYLLQDVFTNWTSTRNTNNLLFINTTEFVICASRPLHKNTNVLCYDSKTLKEIHNMTEHNRSRVHELWLNKKKQKLTSRIPSIPQQGPNLSNLINIEPLTPRTSLFINSIKIGTGNVQSLKNKEQTLLHELIEQDIDIMVVTDTWLTKDDILWLDSCDFNKDTYRIQSAHCQMG